MSLDFPTAFARCPLVAILRGMHPEEADSVGDALVEAGFTLIEVPLNSPSALASVERLATRLDGQVVIGAGTVLKRDDVSRVKEAGGQLIISPNSDMDVINATRQAEMVSMPGYFTPSEAFAALAAGAHALKLFPAEAASPAMLKAQRAVLPRDLPVLAVGSISPDRIAEWRGAGADGFGLGSALYRAGATAAEVGAAARLFLAAWRSSTAA